ncbi:ABC transporter ATP-binding protein [Actinobacillus arthritidis]|uniref:ABC transporter ATP-binding protein n=1 Tax=Actinobacillus arthritidis TaxID=157339 RepID=UPI0024433F25|nr:ATP-binding cassette domain-containing protein [Actinobacillus arthritidis]WGE90003.1 ATP-binding cassette domain-containing protein [Actinobacillus arthritidis]
MNICLSLQEQHCLALVGPSGAGKSLLSKAILGLLPENLQISGRISFKNCEITPEILKQLRGRKIGLIVQNPMQAFDPLMLLIHQFQETFHFHLQMDKESGMRLAEQMVEQVELPKTLLYRYPNQLSGGQLQRMVIALTMALSPELIIADEPTSSLDFATQQALIPLFLKLKQRSSLLFISHDLHLVHLLADEIAVLEQGKIVEQWRNIAEQTPVLTHHISQELLHYAESLTQVTRHTDQVISTTVPLLELTDICKSYPKSHRLFAREYTAILQHISFKLYPGESVGLIGGSGSGKSTLARLICGVEKADQGRILLNGQPIAQTKVRQQHISVVFQDYLSSLNPYFPVWKAVTEPLVILSKQQYLRAEAKRWLPKVGLSLDLLDALPHQLSGGQAQRVCLCRALITQPSLIILDEVLSNLDTINQMQILRLLKQLQTEFKMSFLFITHHLATLEYLCDRTLVLKDGRILS